jgi:LmbE family N-acetylglucosaminyl deacetylase
VKNSVTKTLVGTMAVAAALAVGCARQRLPTTTTTTPPTTTTDALLPASLLVVAPHPDDEVLMAGGLMAAMRRAGRVVSVVIVTNGDLGCGRDGFVRESESIAALALLGVAEDDVVFLGYPDGYLAQFGSRALGPVQRVGVDGVCAPASTTIARRGRHGRDEHTDRTGEAGTFSAPSLVADLRAVMERVKPAAVVVTHDIDDHADHAAVAVFTRRALEDIGQGSLVLRSIVHLGACWPQGSQRRGPCPGTPFQPTTPMPPLPPPFGNYVPQLRVPTSLATQDGPGRKMAAIAAFVSQTGPAPTDDWLASFARLDEPFFPVQLAAAAAGTLVRVAAAGDAAGGVVDVSHRLVLPPSSTAPLRADVVNAAGVVVGTIAVPAAELQTGAGWTLAAQHRPDDGGVVEITVRRDGEFMGLVVDPQPTAPAR